MNRREAFEIEEKYGREAFGVALDILEKERIIGFHNEKINVAKYHIQKNEDKIKVLKSKLVEVLKR